MDEIKRGKFYNENMNMEFTLGYRTALSDGKLVPNSPCHMATEDVYPAKKGDKLLLADENYLFVPAVFAPVCEEKYLYTYDYEPEGNWTTYTKNVTPDSYQASPYIFEEDCFFRVCIKRSDEQEMTESDEKKKNRIIKWESSVTKAELKPFFEEEVEDTVQKISQNPGELTLAILTDSHYAVNGTWDDTAVNIRTVNRELVAKKDSEHGEGFDAIIHLGDMTDGMVSKELTSKRVQSMLEDLKESGAAVLVMPGNHDSNYFWNKARAFTCEEMKELYGVKDGVLHKQNGRKTELSHNILACGNEDLGNRCDQERKRNHLNYCVDVPAYHLRMIFLDSFEDKGPIRYGYSEETLRWLEDTIGNAHDTFGQELKLLIFSHDAPLAQLDYWSYHIRNGNELVDILDRENKRDDTCVIGLLYGHTHADSVYEGASFPMIGIGCNKLEYFLDKKPEGCTVPHRKMTDVSQDLWDVLKIDFDSQMMYLTRFGAGEDRMVAFGMAKENQRTYAENRKREREDADTKIWGHRGASAHAPENTLPSFKLACDMGAHGVEMDVQITKDGELIVIHDETVDRTSDGHGHVKDLTLEELKKLNFNKNFPAYGKVTIPTLEEVLNLLKVYEDVSVNLELKNSIVEYENLEQKTMETVQKLGLENRVIFSSFNHSSMLRMKELYPDAKVAFLHSDGIADPWEYADKYKVTAMHPWVRQIRDREYVQKCHDKGIKVHVWTVNTPEDTKNMIEYGVDAIITNM